jgi:diaminopimelate epimerase
VDLEFSKMHGLGNDFVVIEDLDEDLDFAPEAIEWLCDRNFGIGGDGLIMVRPGAPGSDFFMAYYNADGHAAEMCGNGIRCLAKYVVDHGLVEAERDEIVVDTLGGAKTIQITRDYEGLMYLATVDMGAPILDPAQIPTTIDDDMVVDCPIATELGEFRVTTVSMGNPHAIIVVDDVDDAPVDTVGPLIENDPRFPKKTNVEFAQLVDNEIVALRVWERGVGETLACGTGACATLVAFNLLGLTGREAVVELPGGELAIRWAEDDHVYMTGPAEEVFQGVILVPEDDDAE